MIKTCLFDLDGTLLPMDLNEFVKEYFKTLGAFLVPHGYESEKFVGAMWKGVGAMLHNDGTRFNETAFWQNFCSVFGESAMEDIPLFDEYYHSVYPNLKNICGYNEKAGKLISELHQKGVRLVLATNPMFPPIATKTRLGWSGADISHFDYYTTYENSSYSKPNPEYYREIVTKLGLLPSECLMVGNDVEDDMVAREVGMQVFLLTDCLINAKEKDISVYPHGDFDALTEFINKKISAN